MKISYDISTKDFSVIEDGTFFYNYISFTNNEDSNVVFDNLSFGITIKEGGKVIIEESYPQDGFVYIATDQDCLEIVPSSMLLYNKEYSYSMWVENAGERVDYTFTKLTPKPEKLHDSWIWSDEKQKWQPPIPHPDPDPEKIYQWNEKAQSWDKINE